LSEERSGEEKKSVAHGEVYYDTNRKASHRLSTGVYLRACRVKNRRSRMR
jgi:hypothetical protein